MNKGDLSEVLLELGACLVLIKEGLPWPASEHLGYAIEKYGEAAELYAKQQAGADKDGPA